jgi:hypothetical protein
MEFWIRCSLQLLGVTIIPKKVTDFFRSTIYETVLKREKEDIVRPDMLQLLMQATKGTLRDEISSEDRKNTDKSNGMWIFLWWDQNTNHMPVIYDTKNRFFFCGKVNILMYYVESIDEGWKNLPRILSYNCTMNHGQFIYIYTRQVLGKTMETLQMLQTLRFWTLSIVLFLSTTPFCFYVKHNVSETGFCLRLQVKRICWTQSIELETT